MQGTFEREARDNPGWLAGLPMAVKDYNDVAGQLTTYGSPIFAEYRARADDRTVATLRANGAIPVAKSNVPEFAGSHTFNPVWGDHAQSMEFGPHCRRLFGRRRGGACGRRGLGCQWFVPRRIAAHPRKLLRHCRPASEPGCRAARRWITCL